MPTYHCSAMAVSRMLTQHLGEPGPFVPGKDELRVESLTNEGARPAMEAGCGPVLDNSRQAFHRERCEIDGCFVCTGRLSGSERTMVKP